VIVLKLLVYAWTALALVVFIAGALEPFCRGKVPCEKGCRR